MQPLPPYIDEQTGQRFYNVRQAAQIVEGVSEATMWHWAKKGVTSFGLELAVEREPVIHHRKGTIKPPKTHRETRMLIPEAKVLAMREILQCVGRSRPNFAWTDCERDALRAATRRHRPQLATSHL